MDGNGRWATAKGKPRSFGHQAGVETITRIATECAQIGVKQLTMYAFSTENWNRPTDEVAALMGLVLTALEEEIFMRNNIRFKVIGDRSRLPLDVNKKLSDVEEHTKNNSNAKVMDAPLWDFILFFMAFMRHHLRVCCWWVVTGQGYSSTGSSLFRILSVPSSSPSCK